MKKAELGAVSAVVSFLMTGAFILQNFGIPPLLPHTFRALFGFEAPVYFGLALGARGAYDVVYQLFYTLFLSPIDCYTERDIEFSNAIDLSTIDPLDLLNIFAIFLIYDWIAIEQGLTDPIVFIGGFGIILTTLVFRVVPRIAARYVYNDCLWTVKVTALSIPLTILVFLPTMFFVNVVV